MNRKKSSPELTCEGKQYSYFAFISYTRKDEKQALWLRKHLQSYRLPAKTRRKHPELSARCTRICIDQSDVRPGPLNPELRRQVQSSKYFIIICSRNAVNKPDYLNDELEYFLEGGGEPSNVIPFIVDNVEHPEVDCFPPRLKKLQHQVDGGSILGVNIYREDGKRRGALIKVIARLHGLPVKEVVDDDRQRLVLQSIGVAILSISGLVAVFKAWDYYIPKYSYYLDYVEKNALPVGIGPIPDKHQREAMNAFYCIKTERHGVITELRYQNAQNNLMEVDTELYKDRSPRMVYQYKNNDKILASISHYDQNGRRLLDKSYRDLNRVDLNRYDDDEHWIEGYCLPEQTALGKNDIFDKSFTKSTVTDYYYIYDEHGYVQELHYASESRNVLNAEHDGDGIFGLRYERDTEGRIIKEFYLTYVGDDGNPANIENYEVLGTKTGCYGRTFAYEDFDLTHMKYFGMDNQPILLRGCAAVNYTYNNLHNMEERQYLGADGKPCYNETKGFSSETYSYDASGKQEEIHYFDTYGDPTLCLEGYASVSCVYDPKGRQHILSVKGTDNMPVLSTGCYASVQFDYDEKGNQYQTSYYDTKGNLTLCDEGYAQVRMKYNEGGQVVDAWYYDEQEELTLTNNGYAHMRIQYNALGDRERIDYFSDYDGEDPTLYNGLYASVQMVYDRNHTHDEIWFYGIKDELVSAVLDVAGLKAEYYNDGRLKKFTYYGTDKNPVLCSSGYASAEYSYETNKEVISFSDENGNPCLRNGISTIESEFDNRGRQIEERYYGTQHEPVLSKDTGFAKLVIEYNDRGNKTRVDGFGLDENPTLGSKGYASAAYEYDDREQFTAAYYYGTDGQLIRCEDGNAIERREYDDYGRVIRTSYYGTDDKPINRIDGISAKEYKHDERGNRTSMSYYDAEGFPAESSSGYSTLDNVYDYRGKTLSTTYYDKSGSLTHCKYGYAKVEYQYDLRGNRTSCGYYGIDGQPMLHHDDYAFMEITYNSRNQYKQIRLYGTNHQPILGKNGYSFKEYEYDDAGHNTRMSYYGINHEPVLATVGYSVIEMKYDAWGNVLSIEYYGTNGQLISGENGYARVEHSFDEFGRFCGTAYFGENGEPIIGPPGYARFKATLDEDGNVLFAEKYDSEGNPLP